MLLVTFMHYDLGYFDAETCRLELRGAPGDATDLTASSMSYRTLSPDFVTMSNFFDRLGPIT